MAKPLTAELLSHKFLRVGSGKMIDGFEDALVGMKVGEKKDAKVTFPKDYRETSLAGKRGSIYTESKLHLQRSNGCFSCQTGFYL